MLNIYICQNCDFYNGEECEVVEGEPKPREPDDTCDDFEMINADCWEA